MGPRRLYADANPGTGIANTKHDFTTVGNQTVGLCTFCHTPHKAQSTALLWNHTYSNNTYSWRDTTTTTAGTPLPSFNKTWNGPTPKCLSCHDGSVAVGDLAWFDGRSRQGASNLWDNTHGQGDRVNVGFGGDMSGNHPVVVPYPGVGTRTYGKVTTGTGINLPEWRPDPTALGIVLFRDDGAGSISRIPSSPQPGQNLGIECASCHDPHNKLAVDQLFLRGKLTGSDTSYICLKCHIK